MDVNVIKTVTSNFVRPPVDATSAKRYFKVHSFTLYSNAMSVLFATPTH